MRWKTYLQLCCVVTLVWVTALVFIPSLSQLVEQVILLFLSTNAR